MTALHVGLLHTLTMRAPLRVICFIFAARCVVRLLQDGGGDIDFDEFKTFWDTYNFEVAV